MRDSFTHQFVIESDDIGIAGIQGKKYALIIKFITFSSTSRRNRKSKIYTEINESLFKSPKTTYSGSSRWTLYNKSKFGGINQVY
jgi:hypothetical protein